MKKKDTVPYNVLIEHIQKWSKLPIEDLKTQFETDFEKGLPHTVAIERQKIAGLNELEKKHSFSFFAVLLGQILNPLSLLLILAALATYFLHHILDTIIIAISLGINIIIGLIQEGKASNAFNKLNASQTSYSTVLRDGALKRIHSRDIVPGDILFLEPGVIIPADARIIQETSLEVNESVITGESFPVTKTLTVPEGAAILTDLKNIVWKGTAITGGTAYAIVIAIGSYTQMGAIAAELTGKDTVITPIQKNTRSLARTMATIVVCIMVLIVILGLYRQQGLTEMLLVAIALAVSAVPEGLPAAVTVVLAIGMERLLRKGGLVKNLKAAETLGSTTVILTDKTGTLTEAKMTLVDIITLDSLERKPRSLDTVILDFAARSSDAYIDVEKTTESATVFQGRPVEKAILEASVNRGLHTRETIKKLRKIDYSVFSSDRKYSISLVAYNERNLVIYSGAPEILLKESTLIAREGGTEHLSASIREKLHEEQIKRSKQGERLIGIAYAYTPMQSLKEFKGQNLVFGGFLSFLDPIRKDVATSIKTAQEAGVHIAVVTGDNAETAKRIAIEAGIATEDSPIIHGMNFDTVGDDALIGAAHKGAIFSRMAPYQKMRLVEALRKGEEVVAMTGDGVNDAPAIRNADIGIAVDSGTDVAKEASDLVLMKSSFAVIVEAIKEGRRILDNLKRIVAHLLSTSFGEITLIAGALIVGLPLPILPAQVLWLNIVQEGFLNFAFAFEPVSEEAMKRNPYTKDARNLISKPIRKFIIVTSIITALFTFIIFWFFHSQGMGIDTLRTLMFISLAINALLFVFPLKNFHRPFWRINPFSNKYLIIALSLSTALLLLAFFFSPLKTLLSLTPITFDLLKILIGVALFNLLTIEVTKYIVFSKEEEMSK